jgi:hypothetical protein
LVPRRKSKGWKLFSLRNVYGVISSPARCASSTRLVG